MWGFRTLLFYGDCISFFRHKFPLSIKNFRDLYLRLVCYEYRIDRLAGCIFSTNDLCKSDWQELLYEKLELYYLLFVWARPEHFIITGNLFWFVVFYNDYHVFGSFASQSHSQTINIFSIIFCISRIINKINFPVRNSIWA